METQPTSLSLCVGNPQNEQVMQIFDDVFFVVILIELLDIVE